MYAVYHSARAFDSSFIGPPKRMEGTLTDTYQEALEFAEILTSEHADYIFADKTTPFGIRYAACGNGSEKTGYMLRTLNSSDVYYTVKRVTESE